jgi:thiosulfate dehydrogenase
MVDPNNGQEEINLALRKVFVRTVLLFSYITIVLAVLFFVVPNLSMDEPLTEIATQQANPMNRQPAQTPAFWQAASLNEITDAEQKALVAYGRDLIVQTAAYLGPHGSVRQITNGLNCQNCHLDAGTKVFGNNYGSVASIYPKMRARSGTVENIYKRVNDCIERSLNGSALDTASKEMQAIVAYIEHIGKNVPKGEKALGSGLKDVEYINRAASPDKGRTVYQLKCAVCHQASGEGLKVAANAPAYVYPPLWGDASYNTAAGLYRVSTFARYAKYNMPLGATHDAPQLTDEEAWDVAAYVNSQPRPVKRFDGDWPDISKKPIDHPFGPFADGFTEDQHKYGPYPPIIAAREKQVSN